MYVLATLSEGTRREIIGNDSGTYSRRWSAGKDLCMISFNMVCSLVSHAGHIDILMGVEANLWGLEFEVQFFTPQPT